MSEVIRINNISNYIHEVIGDTLVLKINKEEFSKKQKELEEETRLEDASKLEEENPVKPTKEELTSIFEERLKKLGKKNDDLLLLFKGITEYIPREENPYLVKPKKERAKKEEGKTRITFKSGKSVPNWTTKKGWLDWENEGQPSFYCEACLEVIGKVPKKSCFPTQNRLDNHIKKGCPNE